MNITNWFRFPPSADPARLDAYLSDAAMAELRRAGFTFVRLPVQPAFFAAPRLLRAIQRLRAADLAVVVSLAPHDWALEHSARDRAALLRLWAGLAPALRHIDRDRIFPDILNEPVFTGRTADWTALQNEALRTIRAAWPEATVILTGANWGGIDGLRDLAVPADPNIVISIHVYDPQVLTTLAAFEPNLDRSALAALPFPVRDPTGCAIGTGRTRDVATFYCAQNWDEARLVARINQAATWARQHDVAILVGEFGAADRLNPPARLAWLSATRQAFEAARFGWALWGLDDPMGFHLPRPVPALPVLDVTVLRALGLH